MLGCGGPVRYWHQPRMSPSYNERMCEILGKCAAFSWLARGPGRPGRCIGGKNSQYEVGARWRRVTKADKCLRLTRRFHLGEKDHLCTTDLFLAEMWARKYLLLKMEWINGLIVWYFTRSAQQCRPPSTPSTTTPPVSPNNITAPPPPLKRTAPLLRIRPPGKRLSVMWVMRTKWIQI